MKTWEITYLTTDFKRFILEIRAYYLLTAFALAINEHGIQENQIEQIKLINNY